MTNPLIIAKRIWDGGTATVVPSCMFPDGLSGLSADGLLLVKKQLAGTTLENLGELAARICYDSLGTGRPSEEFHKNILKVNHLSVYEHCTFTVRLESNYETILTWLQPLMNRPNIFTRLGNNREKSSMEVTVNLRHVLEWDKHEQQSLDYRLNNSLGRILRHHAHKLAPAIVSEGQPLVEDEIFNQLVEPSKPQQQWITLLMTGSRGFSHELVRHGDWTAISQRSTRYVDENESPWVGHPLESAFMGHTDHMSGDPVVRSAKERYVQAVQALEPWLIERGIDKSTARKQARGAARGYLGNALLTEVIFSASVSQWLHMLKMRACQAADAEIREVFCKALPELQGSRYGDAFAHLTKIPSPDGIGEIVIDSPEPKDS